jgi:hypothetical protein
MTSARRDLLLLAAAFLLSLPLVTTRIYASDEVQYFSYLRSLWFDRDVSFENEYRYFYDTGVTQYAGFHETFLERTTDTGRRVNFATLGSAVLWSPFYAAADASVRFRGGTADGFAPPYVTAVAYASALYGWLAVVLGWWMARRIVGPIGPLAAAFAVWAGTPLFFYMYVAPPMSHATSAFAVAGFLAAWIVVRGEWRARGLIALGALAALMTMVREQDVFVVVGPAVDWVWTFVRVPRDRTAERRRMVLGVLAGCAAFAAAYLPQLMAYQALNGYPGPSRFVSRKMNWMAPHALSVVLSPRHGFFFWTPLAAAAAAGLAVLARRGAAAAVTPLPRPTALAIGLLLVVALQIYVAGSVESWTVAGAFGQRRFVGLSSVLIVGTAMLWSIARTRGARIAVACGLALAIWWNIGLMAQFGSGLMDRQRLEPGRNAYHTFVTIPARLPELVYRYVFERSTFYRK